MGEESGASEAKEELSSAAAARTAGNDDGKEGHRASNRADPKPQTPPLMGRGLAMNMEEEGMHQLAN
jgi:hypothetical protein